MKTCHLPSSTGASPAPTRSSTAGRTATVSAPLARVTGALALTVLGAGTTLAQVGTNYCTAVPNSTGATAVISASGSLMVSSNDLSLTAFGLPLNSAAYFLCSRTQGFDMNHAGSAGNLCLGNPVGRLVGGVIANSGWLGLVAVPADLSAMPQPSGAVVVQPGETWNFQCWYRDAAVGGGSTSNFSDGLAVLFTGVTYPIPGMVQIPAGMFQMGSNAASGTPYYGTFSELPVHHVTISYPFWMGQYEVTQGEYLALMGTNPSYFQGASLPVEQVSWLQARAYCAAMTARLAGLGNIPPGYEYRLPTEAEWEYACRAGTTTEFHTGSGLFCNQAQIYSSLHTIPNVQCPNWAGSTVSVGSFAPNSFGLFDMHGNVLEWCLDSYAPYTSAPVTDPFVTGGPSRVLRGGSWTGASDRCRSAVRGQQPASSGYFAYGFRVVLAPVLVP